MYKSTKKKNQKKNHRQMDSFESILKWFIVDGRKIQSEFNLKYPPTLMTISNHSNVANITDNQ